MIFPLQPSPTLADKLDMTQSLAKYHARSPRYILQPQDNTLVRVAGPSQIPWEEGTEIKNISLSGLAFTARSDLCPMVGEFIKIQFQVPGAEEMACYGLVTRLEAQSSHEMLVGIQFYKLEMAHRIVLLQGLAQKLRDQIEGQRQQEQRTFKAFFLRNWRDSSMIILMLSLWIGLLLWTWSFIDKI